MLRRIAADWMASGIAISHIVAVIDRHLTDYRSRYYSGSGEALFSWVDELSAGHGASRTSRHHRPNLDGQRCNELSIANGSIARSRSQAQPFQPGSACGQLRNFPWIRQSRSRGVPERKVDWQRTKGPKRIDQAIASFFASLLMARSQRLSLRKGLKQAAFRCER